jgi:hypothetical protein
MLLQPNQIIADRKKRFPSATLADKDKVTPRKHPPNTGLWLSIPATKIEGSDA